MFNRSRVLAGFSVLILFLFVGVAAVSAQDKKGQKLDKAQQQEVAAAIKILDDVQAGHPAPNDFPFTWQNHSMKSREQKIYVPFTLTFDRDKVPPTSITYFIRFIARASSADSAKAAAAKAAADKAESLARLDPGNPDFAEQAAKAKAQSKVEYAFEDVRFLDLRAEAGQPARMRRAASVLPGDYDVYVLIKERAGKDKKATPRASVLKVEVSVPNYYTDELVTSSVIVTNKAEQLNAPPSEADMASDPYVFGLTRVTPITSTKFTKKDELTILFVIYNNGLDKGTHKPDVTVEYLFYKKNGADEKYFNKTNPLKFNAQTLPPQFDTNAGHQLLVGQGLPLASFPDGDYRLEIKVTDQVTGKAKVQSFPFSVNAG